MPWCSDGPVEAELAGTIQTALSYWADQAHEQGGTVILPHFPAPNGEPAALIATGRIDGVEMIHQMEYNHLDYYRYLKLRLSNSPAGRDGQDVQRRSGGNVPNLRLRS